MEKVLLFLIRRCVTPHQHEAIPNCAWGTVRRRVYDFTCKPECGGTPAVHVNGLIATKFPHEHRRLAEAHPAGKLLLPAIDNHEEDFLVVVANKRPRRTGARLCGVWGCRILTSV